MSLSPQEIERLPHVEGVLTYIAPMAEKPYNLAYDPPPGTPRSNSRPDPHTVPVYDMRPIADRLDFDREGIALIESRTSFEDPSAPADKLPRESIEIRMLVFHDG